jgi:Neurochondrin
MHACMHAQPGQYTCNPIQLLHVVYETSWIDHRFTGLLLATKFLPAGDASVIKAVHDAVGIAFIQRLLLSLSSSNVRTTFKYVSGLIGM